jgi:putative NAD(P)-binding protein
MKRGRRESRPPQGLGGNEPYGHPGTSGGASTPSLGRLPRVKRSAARMRRAEAHPWLPEGKAVTSDILRSTMRVCIVGASGKLGRYMVQHALDRGYEVVGVCREESVGKLDAFKGRITVVPGATNDLEVIERAVAECDGVLVVLVPRGVHGYSTGTRRRCSTTRLRERASCSRAGGTSRSTARTCTRGSSRRS